ncbi:MAG TPA: DUF721 domain-containing protein [Candidatus Krumholzibacteria bacterium]|nr:DUF721 domain-containing protein [Candidatus Krumholzibacteria bacterium]
MGRRRQPGKLEPVGPVVGALLQGLGLEKRLQEYEAVHVWEDVVGAAVAAHARATAIQEGVLFVEVDSSVWLQELGLLRESIVERLNARLGAVWVRRIVLSAERTPSERALPGPEEG